jgi:hypothetical protein
MIPIAALSVAGAVIFVVMGYLVASLRRAPAAAAALGPEARQLKERLDLEVAKAARLEASVASAEESRCALVAELDRVRRGAAGAAELESQLQSERSRAAQVEAERLALAARLEAQQHRVDTVDAEKARLAAELETARAKARQAAAASESQVATIEALQKRSQQAEADRQLLSSQLASAQAVADKTEKRGTKQMFPLKADELSVLDTLKLQLEEKEVQLEQARQAQLGAEQRINQLVEELEKVRTWAEDDRTIDTERGEPTQVVTVPEPGEIEKASGEIASLKRDLAKQSALRSGAEADLERTRKELDEAKSRLAAASGPNEDLSKARGEATRLQLRLSNAEREVATARRDLEEARGQSKELERKAADSAAEARRAATARGEELDRLRKEIEQLRLQLSERRSLTSELTALQAELKEARVKAQAAESRFEELERLLDDNRRLREELRELEGLRGAAQELASLRAAQQNLRLELEVGARRLEDAERLEAELAESRRSVATLARDAAEAGELRTRLSSLEAQLYAAGLTPRQTPGADDAGERARRVLAEHGPIDDVLTRIVASAGVRTAVVADLQGLLVGACGEDGPVEEMAAISGTAEALATRATQILPLDQVHCVCLYDINDLALSCHYFKSGGDTFALTTLRRGSSLPSDVVSETVRELSKALGE